MLRLFGASPTFPHATKWVLAGFVGTHSAHHLGSPHPRLVALGVGSHGVPPGKCRVSAVSKRVLQVNTTSTEGESRQMRHDASIVNSFIYLVLQTYCVFEIPNYLSDRLQFGIRQRIFLFTLNKA